MKKLARYLAAYLDREITEYEKSEHENQSGEYFSESLLCEWVSEGLDAFQSTEDCTIVITENPAEKPLNELTDKETEDKIALTLLTDIIYDTLMENKSPPYEALDLGKVENQQVDAVGGLITFDYEDVSVKMTVITDRL